MMFDMKIENMQIVNVPKGDICITLQTMGQFNENDDQCMAQRMVPQSHQFWCMKWQRNTKACLEK